MFCDYIQGRDNPWKDIFAMNRHMLHGGLLEYIKQNFDYPYYLVTDSLKPAEAKSTRSVRRGQGKIVLVNDQKAACYRDENGKLTTVSAVCTHMGCLVHWNDAEKTWDCPCHGSRFNPTGEVIGGPAETPLEPIETKKPGAATNTNTLPQEA
jgi:Rieske Fe-S protein